MRREHTRIRGREKDAVLCARARLRPTEAHERGRNARDASAAARQRWRRRSRAQLEVVARVEARERVAAERALERAPLAVARARAALERRRRDERRV